MKLKSVILRGDAVSIYYLEILIEKDTAKVRNLWVTVYHSHTKPSSVSRGRSS